MKKCIIEAYIIKVKVKFTNGKFHDNMMSDKTLSDGHAKKIPIFVHSQFMRSVAGNKLHSLPQSRTYPTYKLPVENSYGEFVFPFFTIPQFSGQCFLN